MYQVYLILDNIVAFLFFVSVRDLLTTSEDLVPFKILLAS